MRSFKNLFVIFCNFFILLFFISNAFAIPQINMTPGVTPISQDIYRLHMTIFIICVIIGIIVFSIMGYALIKHRKSAEHKPAQFHEHTRLEIFWAVVPLLILIVMAIPATKVLINMNDSNKPDVNIKITGYQWKWKYEYLDNGISFFSNLATPYNQITNQVPKSQWYLLEVDKPLVVPIHKKIRFLITSNDVIHSWWVPALGIKRDAIPGFIYEAWARIDKPGIYRGQCAELCGINHAYMPIVVQAVTMEDYQKWLAKNASPGTVIIPGQPATQPVSPAVPAGAPAAPVTRTKEELMKQGEEVYSQHCLVCHQAEGQGMPPAFPALKGGAITTGAVAGHIDIVLHGKKGTAMQPFGEQLSDDDIAAVITYERNSWGNAGGIVQSADIQKAKGKSP